VSAQVSLEVRALVVELDAALVGTAVDDRVGKVGEGATTSTSGVVDATGCNTSHCDVKILVGGAHCGSEGHEVLVDG